eukprot:3472993-Rhodomonas_salina.2
MVKRFCTREGTTQSDQDVRVGDGEKHNPNEGAILHARCHEHCQQKDRRVRCITDHPHSSHRGATMGRRDSHPFDSPSPESL